jgi:hypothetical protein
MMYSSLHLRRVLLPGLLLEQVVTSEGKGWQGLASDDHRYMVQIPQGIDDHGRIRHRMPDVAQEIDEVLEAVQVVIDGQFTLEETCRCFLHRQ